MLELEDIIEPPLPPASDAPSAWSIVAAVVVLALIGWLVVRALLPNKRTKTDAAAPLDIARHGLKDIESTTSESAQTDSFPTLIHAWAKDALAHREQLPQAVVAELEHAEQLVAPYCYQPQTRWMTHLNRDEILASLHAVIDEKGGSKK